jgi:deoxyadenosine/deoxycytidine kinase
VPYLKNATCVDGSSLADRFAFCEVLHRDMDVSYLTKDALDIIDRRLEEEFRPLPATSLLIMLEGPLDYLFQNIRERHRAEEKKEGEEAGGGDVPEGLSRLVKALNTRYAEFTDILWKSNWYNGPILKIDVSKIDFISNVRHLIAVYEGIESLIGA